MLDERARHLRQMILEVLRRSGAGHAATALSCADIITALYHGGALRLDPMTPDKPDRDRFLMSKGHAATALYCALADLGFFPLEELWRTAGVDGRMGVHLQRDVPGVEATSGSLGQGLGLGCGMALAARRTRADWLTFVLLGDGELNEGSVWEALLFAGHHRLNNLAAIVDRNHMCCSDYTENCLSLEPLDKKLTSFGWEARTIDGHDPDAMAVEFRKLRGRPSSKPTVFIAETIKGKGIPWEENAPMCHFYHPQGEELERAIAQLAEG
jgi:transketolase